MTTFEGELGTVEPGGCLGSFPTNLTAEHQVDAEAGCAEEADVRLSMQATSPPSSSERQDFVALEKYA